MNCPLESRGSPELLIAYASQGLDPKRAAALDGHLAECSACREFVHRQSTVWQALDTWEAAPVSVDFDRRLHARLSTDLSWWQRQWQGLSLVFGPLAVRRAVPVAATAALLIAAGLLLNRPALPPAAPAQTATAQIETLRPDQVVDALDQMDALSQFNHSLKADSDPRM